jgi:hypothetical protein
MKSYAPVETQAIAELKRLFECQTDNRETAHRRDPGAVAAGRSSIRGGSNERTQGQGRQHGSVLRNARVTAGRRYSRRRLLRRRPTLNWKLCRKEFFWRFEMKLTVFFLFAALTTGAQSTIPHLPTSEGRPLLDGRSTSRDLALPTCIWVRGFRTHPARQQKRNFTWAPTLWWSLRIQMSYRVSTAMGPTACHT